MNDTIVFLIAFSFFVNVWIIGLALMFGKNIYKWFCRADDAVKYINEEVENINDVLDWFEADEKVETADENEKVSGTITSITYSNSDEATTEEIQPKQKDAWNDLDALELERDLILSNSAAMNQIADPLDHLRSVEERIADLKDKNTPTG